METDIIKLENLIKDYNEFLIKDYEIASHKIKLESLNEEKALNDNLALRINAEIKKFERKYNSFPLPYITDKMMGKKRIIKNDIKIKVNHLLPIKSIDKMNIGDNLSDIFHNINNLIIMPKYDGVSCICWYDKNKIIFGTKSNDMQGEDITNICSKIVDIELLESFFKTYPEIIGIRGELILDKKYNPNITRLAELNGLLRSKEPDIKMFPYMHIIFYFVYADPNKIIKKSLYEYLTILKEYNTEISLVFQKPAKINTIDEKIMNTLNEVLSVSYDCDGIIFRENTLDFDSSIAVKKAYYFEAKVTKIEFILGEKTGIYVPKLYIEYNDSNINKTITKIHAYNLNYLFTNKIQIGSIIKIKYTGDTIAVIDKLISKGFPKTSTFNKYLEYIKNYSSGLDNAFFHDDEFIGQVDYLYNFIKKQNLPGGGTVRIKDYLNAIYPNRLNIKDKTELYKTYLYVLNQNKYKANFGITEETIQLFSNNIITLLKNKKKTLELTIDSLSIASLTYSNFNKFSMHLVIETDKNNFITDIKKAYKINTNVTSQTILDNKQDFIAIYNLILSF
jgi:hypothetical protein